MKFTFVTLFEELMSGYFEASILKRAKDKNIIDIEFVNPRDFTTDKYNKVDAPIVSGGAGMLIFAQPMFDAISNIKSMDPEAHVIFVTPVGKSFKDSDARRFAKKSHIAIVCGRYEGIDERVIEELADEVMSVGDFVLTGGELAALSICDATSRYVDGVLGNALSLQVESFSQDMLEPPAFAKPVEFRGKSVISEFLKGNHSKITDLKNRLALCKTKYHRPDLYIKRQKDA